MLSLRVRPLVFSALTPSTHGRRALKSLSLSLPHQNPLKIFSSSSSSSSSSTTTSISTSNMSTTTTQDQTQTIEHIVLFNVNPNTDPSKISTMIDNLNSLTSLDQVLHLSAGPIFRNRSSQPFKFTHLLHSRYASKSDLSAYSAHPDHLSVVRSSVLPICDDILAVDWVSDRRIPAAVSPGSAFRVTLLKIKEGVGDGTKDEVLGVIGGLEDRIGDGVLEELSFGENFSPERAKGFSIGSIAVFKGLRELENLNSGELESEKEKVRDLLESVIVVDYVVPDRALSPSSASASL